MSIIWITDNTDYPLFILKLLSWVSFSSVLVSTTYFLCNRILPKSIEKGKVGLIVAQLLGMAILQGLILGALQHGFYYLEDNGFIPTFDEEDRDSLFTNVLEFLPLSFLINLGFGGLKSYFQHLKLYEQHLKLQKVHLEMQLQSLKSQINPHFMFNVLNHIHILIHKNTDLASCLLLKYSDILRYQLQCTNKEMVSLRDDVDFMNNYIEVEKYRWEDTLEVTCSWEIQKPDVQIPPLLLIIFIENAFKYVSRSKSQKGYINISLVQDGEKIAFEVENSKLSCPENNYNSPKIGLENVRKRLELQYPDRHRFTVQETDTVYKTNLVII
ncbi:sensor histidine kinase [Pseudopedobacter beijingensis]|uniref:Sensor histidine kinase n=1 Tax=Pseudopedobacter beijingensis TaxID=1207056 RepID=A0ABW4IBD5_9SPHI